MYQDMSGMGFFWMVIMAVAMVIPFWRICTRVGYHGAWSLLVLIPLANLLFFYFLAFSRWPARHTTPEP